MNLTIIEQPPFEPVSLEDCYAHLRLDPDGSPPTHPDDTLLTGQIVAARIYAENQQQRSLIQRTLRLSFSAHDMCGRRRRYEGHYVTPEMIYGMGGSFHCGRDYIELPRPPLGWVSSVSYYDSTNTLQVLDESQYYVTDDFVPQLRFVTGFSWPSTYWRSDAIRVEYIAGYLPVNSPSETQDDYASVVPENVKAAILLGVQILYDQPIGDTLTALQNSRDALLAIDSVDVLA